MNAALIIVIGRNTQHHRHHAVGLSRIHIAPVGA